MPSELDRLYDLQPVTLLMTGGPQDGVTVKWAGGGQPPIYRFAVPPAVPYLVSPQPPGAMPAFPAIDDYTWTGSVLDGGTRVYRYLGRFP